jgi:sialic acid synthase SpsE
MSTIILDLSSGNTCRNDKTIVKQMIDAIKAIDTGKHEIILKWQLSLNDGINVPLDHDVFDYAYKYGNEQGYKTTSSVADLESLKFLLEYDVPFVKLPNCRELDWLIGEVPRKIPVFVSVKEAFPKPPESHLLCGDGLKENEEGKIKLLCCISKYPANLEEYEKKFTRKSGYYGHQYDYDVVSNAVSDHTIGLDLFKKYQPQIWEKHFKLPDSTGLDAGEFAIPPEELEEIL